MNAQIGTGIYTFGKCMLNLESNIFRSRIDGQTEGYGQTERGEAGQRETRGLLMELDLAEGL